MKHGVHWVEIASVAAEDRARATGLMQKSCDGGDMPACDRLDAAHMSGAGMDQEFVQAHALFKKSCNVGDFEG